MHEPLFSCSGVTRVEHGVTTFEDIVLRADAGPFKTGDRLDRAVYNVLKRQLLLVRGDQTFAMETESVWADAE